MALEHRVRGGLTTRGGRRGRPGRRARADGAGGVPAPAGPLAARRADAQAQGGQPRPHRLRPHHAPQHALRRHPVLPGHRRRARGQAAAGDPHRRVAVGAGHRPVHPAPGARAAEPVRAGARVRVRRRPRRDHRPVRGPPGGAGARAGVRRRRARRGRQLRLRRRVRQVHRGLRLRGEPALHGDRARRRPRQRQRPEPRGVRRDHPPGPGDDLAHPRTPVLVGAGRLRPARLRRVLQPGARRARPHRAGVPRPRRWPTELVGR